MPSMIMMRALLFATLLALVAVGALAGEPIYLPSDAADPSRIRYVTTTASSSTCIGRPRNPICGIETEIGCIEYVRSSRCDRLRNPNVLKESRPVRVEYVIDKSGFVNPKQVRHVLRYGYVDEFLYYVYPSSFQARVLLRECPDTQHSCEGIKWTDLLFTINRRKGAWIGSTIAIYFFEDHYLVD